MNECFKIQLAKYGILSETDMQLVKSRRRDYNKLGFAYQLVFVKVYNYFPNQYSFPVISDILTFVSIQLAISELIINEYSKRQATISEHQNEIRNYLALLKFEEAEQELFRDFVFKEALQFESSHILHLKAENYLRERKILKPSDDTIRRIIGAQKEAVRKQIQEQIYRQLTAEIKSKLDNFISIDDKYSRFQLLKNPPNRASAGAILEQIDKLKLIKDSGILTIKTGINNNYLRILAKYAYRCSAYRLRQLEEKNRYTVLICFLIHSYHELIDYVIDMYNKLISSTYKSAKKELALELHQHRKNIQQSITILHQISATLLNTEILDVNIREEIFKRVSKDKLELCLENTTDILHGKYQDEFRLFTNRFSYFRQFTPALLEVLDFQADGSSVTELFEAINLLKELNKSHKRKLPDDAPIGFIPNKLKKLIIDGNNLNKASWECALITKIKDEIKAGNLSVSNSKRFGKFDSFFMPESEWKNLRSDFFKKANLPESPKDVAEYLTKRLNVAYDNYLTKEESNTYSKIEDGKWALSVDPALELTPQEADDLAKLQAWLAKHMRPIKLPDLLIEVDNKLQFTNYLLPINKQTSRNADDISAVLAAIMAHGCFIGTYTMSRITPGISYEQIRQVSDWYLTEENLRSVLVALVKAISDLDVTRNWGDGSTSSSDGQRYEFKQSVLNQTYSTRFGDMALEFYTFMADNYAPFYSLPMESTNRDAPYVLDGILYNETELALNEHYTDTHGYTEITFTAFGMYGKIFSPRIKGVQHQRLYKIDTNYNYGSLASLISSKDHLIHMDWIVKDWDKMGQFYASLEKGYATASVALKRLVTFTSKNHFYRANRELGRIFKTENILNYMADPLLRLNRRKGLLKGEQIHQLAREVAFGKRGKVRARDFYEQKNTCSCLTLILACIIYWQSSEIMRIVNQCNPSSENINLKLLEHISPISWDNILLYGEYVINKGLIK
mgnify:CR=1 FL=1